MEEDKRNEPKKKGKGTNEIPPKALDNKSDGQLLAKLRRENEVMKKWYNKNCQFVPVKVKEMADHILHQLTEITLKFDEETQESFQFTIYDTPDKHRLIESLDKLLAQPGTPAEQKPEESHDKESNLRIKYRSDINELTKKLDMVGPENKSVMEIDFARLKYRRLILENEKALVYGRYWKDLYQEIAGRGWKCVDSEDIHDLVQVMMNDKYVKFTDKDPTLIHWTTSLVTGMDGDDSWERRHNFPDNTISCFGPLPSLDDTPKAFTFECIDKGYEKVCNEYMENWKIYMESVDKEFEDPEDAFKFKRSLLEEEREQLDDEEINSLMCMLTMNVRKWYDNGEGLGEYDKKKWDRLLTRAVLEMQKGGCLSGMCLPAYFKMFYDKKNVEDAEEALKAATEAKDPDEISGAEYRLMEAETEWYKEVLNIPLPFYERDAEMARDQKRRTIFGKIKRITK